MLLNLVQPLVHVVKGFSAGGIVDENKAICVAVVIACDDAEPFLACSVPLRRQPNPTVQSTSAAAYQLQLDEFALDHGDDCLEVDANR